MGVWTSRAHRPRREHVESTPAAPPRKRRLARNRLRRSTSPDLFAAGEDWLAEARMTVGPHGEPAGAEVYAHFSPRLDRLGRQRALDDVRGIAAEGRITLASRSDVAHTMH